ncbi:MAG: ArsR/SmtB family transcription factor [Massiliimalia sp.]|jgi:predicted transcriptional regulator
MLQLSIQDPHAVAKICHALSTELRLNILRLLEHGTMSCLELSKKLEYPLSTISANVKILEEAGLIVTELQPAKNGSKKLCSLVYLDLAIQLTTGVVVPPNSRRYEIQIPIGNYMDFQVFPSCGYVGEEVPSVRFDSPNSFLSPDRLKAQLLWFRKGYVEYRIPLEDPQLFQGKIKQIAFELEICSEAPGFNQKWKSDITMWINGIEIGTWTSPADFGDRKGAYTPEFWGLGNTQYGILTCWKVDGSGSYLNDGQLSDVCLEQLNMEAKSDVTLRIGVKENSSHIGGINIFGKGFGDYDQGIRMILEYDEKDS